VTRTGSSEATGARDQSFKLDVEPMGEGHVAVGSPKCLEARAVVGELGAVLRFVQLLPRQHGELVGFGDLVRREDGARPGVCTRDAFA
jgi:hypothetical protein